MTTTDASQGKPAEIEHISDPVADNPNPDIGTAPAAVERAAAAEADDAAPPARPESSDEKRKRIADRMRAKRNGTLEDFDGDFTDRRAMYGEGVGREGEQAPEPVAAEPAADAADAPVRKLKLKVRHEERELTEQEVIELAQKAAAADSYFEDGKQYLARAKEIHDEAVRGQSRPHQGEQRTQDDLAPEPSADAPHQEDEFQKLAEEIQFGDPKDAGKKLRSTVAKAVAEETEATFLRNKVNEDQAASLRALKQFKDANPELATDPDAEAVMERRMYQEYAADLRRIGLPEDRIPTDPMQLANWHRLYRVQGQAVRSTAELLTHVKGKFDEWRGGGTKPTPAPAPGNRVVVDRTARRADIPTQPTRATTPTPAQSASATPQLTPRQKAVQNARKARGQTT